uniref:S100 A11-like protein n=1 Tax=Pithecopus nordestinus TaxID=2034992 RepID=K9N182_PITNO|nr:S100 A11-like protein [Pithecopus nordestinus]
MEIPIQDLMISMISAFNKYASGDGDNNTLNKKELVNMACKEFPSLEKHPQKDKFLNDIFKITDRDGDNKINFEEFMTLMTCMTIALRKSGTI